MPLLCNCNRIQDYLYLFSLSLLISRCYWTWRESCSLCSTSMTRSTWRAARWRCSRQIAALGSSTSRSARYLKHTDIIRWELLPKSTFTYASSRLPNLASPYVILQVFLYVGIQNGFPYLILPFATLRALSACSMYTHYLFCPLFILDCNIVLLLRAFRVGRICQWNCMSPDMSLF